MVLMPPSLPQTPDISHSYSVGIVQIGYFSGYAAPMKIDLTYRQWKRKQYHEVMDDPI